jgi:hypothetical protein
MILTALMAALVISSPQAHNSQSADKWVEVNRVLLLTQDTIPPDPYTDSIAVASKLFAHSAESLIREGVILEPIANDPEISVLDSTGQPLPWAEYAKRSGAFSQATFCLQMKIGWTGAITYVKLVKYRGHIDPKFDFVDFAKKLRATPATKFGVPYSLSGEFMFPMH